MLVFWLFVLVLVVAVFLYSVLPNLQTRVFRTGGICRGPDVEAVALTFDDGPDRAYTGDVLDVLRNEHVRATFFVLARNAVEEPELVNRMRREGHEVQIHGLTHLFVPLLSIGKTKEQIEQASCLLREKYGIRTSYYRPTWGLCNLISVVCAKKAGHKIVTWSVMVGDWRITQPEVLVKKMMQKLTSGAIIVLHDSDKTFGAEAGAPRSVVLALPAFIASVRAKGYGFSTLSELTGKGQGHE
jgi:peptidoglycan-N-acetylglucosamine deacetylase